VSFVVTDYGQRRSAIRLTTSQSLPGPYLDQELNHDIGHNMPSE
jgi:hypothetical protein